MSDLLELAARVESAAGPDRELDAVIHVLTELAEFGTIEADIENALRVVRDEEPLDIDESPVREYTASLDAAMTLVPEGWDWSAGTAGYGRGGHAYLRPAQAMTAPGEAITVDAATPALALCAAALKARSAQS